MRSDTKAALVFLAGALLWFLPWLWPGQALLGTHPALYRPHDELITAEQRAEIAAVAHPLYGDKLIQHDPEVRFGNQPGEWLPTWNPWVLGGVPHVAQGLASPLYPLLWIARLVPPPHCYAWIAAVQMVLQAWFAYRMLHAFGVRAAACGVFALLFAGGGWMSVHQEYFQLTAAATWLPLALGATRRLLDQKGGLFALAVAIGCAFLSGFPQIGFYVVLSVALLWAATIAVRLVRGRERGGDLLRHIGRFAVAGLLGLGLASPQLLATAEFVPHATRQPRSPEALASAALPAAGLAGALLPDLFTPSYSQADFDAEVARAAAEKRTPWLDTLFARTLLHSLRTEATVNRFEITFALGPAALLLALLGAWRGRRAARAFLLLLLAVGVVLTVRSPLLLALAHLPGFNIGDPKRGLLLVATALAGLAALGVEALLDQRRTRTVALWLHGGALALLLVAAGYAQSITAEALRRFAAPRLAADLSAQLGSEVAPATIAAALPDPLLLAQRGLLVRELLFAALFVAVAGAALAWLAREQASRPSTDRARETVPVARLTAFIAALALPLLLLWHDATRPIPLAGLEQKPSIAQHFERSPPTGRLVRVGPRSTDAATWAWPPKLPMNSRVRDAHGYVAAYLRRWAELFEALEPGSAMEVAVLSIADPAALSRPLADLLDLEYALAVLPNGTPPPAPAGFDRLAIDPPPPPGLPYQLLLWRNREPFGRARIVPRVRVAPDDATVLAELAKRDFAPREVAWVTAVDAAPLRSHSDWAEQAAASADGIERWHAATATDGATGSTVELIDETSDELRFRVRGSGGLLVQTDAWYPGWSAIVDGIETPLLRVNHGLRGVAVPAGDHDVQFRYVPRRLRLGLLLAAGALALMLHAAAKLGRDNLLRA